MSTTHWLIIVAAFVILFGARRLPDAARSMGRSLRIFRSEMNEMHSGTTSVADQPAPPADSAATPPAHTDAVVRTIPEPRRAAASG